jgi:diguanylate cyclase (GGDEF)-like protein
MTTTTVHEPAPAHGLDRQKLCVLGLIAACLAVGAAAGLPFLGSGPLLPGVPLPWWVLTVAFMVTEHFVLHIQVRREAHTLSLAELPLVLGLFFAAPLQLLAGRLLASVLTHLLVRRARPLKGAFNLGLGLLETGFAVAVFRLLAPEDGGAGPLSWAAAYAGALSADALSALAVAAVIALHDGGVNVRAALVEGVLQPMPAVAVTTSLLAVVSLAASPSSAPLVLVFAAVLLVSFRAYASLAERHLNLERLYHFSQAVSTGPELDDVMRSVLSEAKELLRAEQAAVALLPTDGGPVTRIRLDSGGRLSRSEEPAAAEDRWLVQQVVHRGTPLLLPRTTVNLEALAWLSANGLREAVVVPLVGGLDVAGVLVVGDRLGVIRTFEHDDVLLLETVANHSGVALRNSQLIAQLRHDARHDALTGLPNRADLQRRLSAALADVSAGHAPGAAVMILDLDEFKAVNDTLGHHQGDQLLVEVAERLTSAVGGAGTVARLGGDEFAVLVTDTADEDRVMRIGRRVLRSLEQPIALDGLEVEVGASVGVALAPDHATDPAVLLKRADLAMYDAKASSRGLRLYEPELHTDSPRRLTLVSELRAALQNGTVDVHVQPKARVRTGEVVGVEALVRWQHPELGWVPPDEFVPVAERSGLIGLLTTRVLDASLAACAQWRTAGRDLGVAVNLSARSLQDADLVEEVARMLRRHGVPANRLTLEVTEGSVMADAARAVALLHELRDLGVRLSVDDFGTGYSSLSYLQRLPVHEVKIDRSFVTGLGREGENLVIVRAIIDLGHHLGLEVVAEGVEDRATSDLLASMSCDLVQGWHLARPMPTGDLLGWLTSHRTGRSLRAV